MSTALRLQTREARKKLPRRSEPYWLEISRGRYIGYRRGATGGFWLLREHCQGMGKKGAYIKRRLGPADDDGAGDGVLSWDDARKQAEGEDRPTVTVPGRYTVAQAAEAYFATRSATGEQDKLTFATFIAPKLGRKPVAELTTGDIESWLAAQVPATADREARRAAQATANRHQCLARNPQFGVSEGSRSGAVGHRMAPCHLDHDLAAVSLRGLIASDGRSWQGTIDISAGDHERALIALQCLQAFGTLAATTQVSARQSSQ
jgi:hypothetical protein